MKPLRLLFYHGVNPQTGLGHVHRSLALARTAAGRGHQAYIASDRKPAGLPHLPCKYLDPGDFVTALKAADPDWLIVDLPHTPPAWIRELTDCKIVTLNGIGYNQNDGADLRIVQGLADLELPGQQDKVPTLKGIEYIILRLELAEYRDEADKSPFTFVWAGAADVMGMLPRYSLVCSDWLSTLFIVDMTPYPTVFTPNHAVMKLNQDTEDMLVWMVGSKKAVVAMGMCVYELAFLQVPVFCFNASDLHLRFARAAEKAGLLKTWPGVGLPCSNEAMREFLEQPFEVTRDSGLTLDGATNVMEAIEGF